MVDTQPFPGLTVTPVYGVVPVGGLAELTLELHPNALIKFDTRINIVIRGGKTLELRTAGAVEPPCVDIDLVCLCNTVFKYWAYNYVWINKH